MLGGYSMMVSISSLFALFIGMFIIYNSFAIAVTQRRSEIGILRALGATRGQIRWLFLGESAVTGLIGSLAGVAFGVLIARGIAASIGALISDVYGVAQRADEVVDEPGAARAGARRSASRPAWSPPLIPARSAARVDPVQALQKGKYQVLSAGESRLRAIAGRGAWRRRRSCCLPDRRDRAPCSTSATCWRSSPRCCSARCCRLALARAIRPAAEVAAAGRRRARRRQPDSGAAPHVGERRRADALAGAGRGVCRHGARQLRSIIDWMDTALNPDLFVMPSQSIVDPHDAFPATMAAELAAIPGVERVQMVRDARIMFRNTPVMIVAVEIDERRARPRSRAPVAGDAATMYRQAAAGEGLMVSDNLAQLQQLTLGDMLEIAGAGRASSVCRSSASSSTIRISRARS